MTDAEATTLIQKAMPLCRTLDIRAAAFTPDEVVLSLVWSAELCTTAGMLHGGALMALADSAGAVSASRSAASVFP